MVEKVTTFKLGSLLPVLEKVAAVEQCFNAAGDQESDDFRTVCHSFQWSRKWRLSNSASPLPVIEKVMTFDLYVSAASDQESDDF